MAEIPITVEGDVEPLRRWAEAGDAVARSDLRGRPLAVEAVPAGARGTCWDGQVVRAANPVTCIARGRRPTRD